MPRSPLGQLMVNLVKNSYEAIIEQQARGPLQGGEGHVDLTVALDSEDSANWYFEIRDNGIGFPPALAETLFRAGYTTKMDGSGMGLHSAANSVNAMGGRISLQSEGEGRGAVIKVSLPLQCPRKC